MVSLVLLTQHTAHSAHPGRNDSIRYHATP
jgi:hypothetical protein